MLTDILASALQTPTEISKGTHDVRHRGTTWLRNMRIDHVAIVGKGANRRTFTVMKADNATDLFGRLERVLTEWLAAS